MAGMMFWLLIIVIFALGIPISAGALWLSARALGFRPTLKEVALLVGIMYFLGAVSLIVDLSETGGGVGSVAAAVSVLAVCVAAVRYVLEASWLRSAGVFGLYMLIHFVATLPLALGMSATVGKTFIIPDVSAMAPTLIEGDRIMVDRLAKPKRWDLIAFYTPTEPDVVYPKRVVGLPGETIEIVSGEISVNGALVTKPPSLAFLAYEGTAVMGPCTGCTGSPLTLGADEYYVLGDNPPLSNDSRYWQTAETGAQLGAVPRRSIIGVVRVRYAPLRRLRFWE